MVNSASLYIVKDGNIKCIYGEKCFQSGLCHDIIFSLKKNLGMHLPFNLNVSPGSAIIDTIRTVSEKPYHFGCIGFDGKGNNFSLYQFAERLEDRVCCNTTVNVNHPKAEKIRESILAVVEPLTEKGYKVEKS